MTATAQPTQFRDPQGRTTARAETRGNITTYYDLTGRITLALKTRPENLAVSRAYAHLFKQM